MQKVQFNYEVWKNHPEREKIKLVTRNGAPVTCFTDAYVGKINNSMQLHGVQDYEFLDWDLTGSFWGNGSESGLDLFMILPEGPEMWVNVYEDEYGILDCGAIYTSKEIAENKLRIIQDKHIGTFKLVKQ